MIFFLRFKEYSFFRVKEKDIALKKEEKEL